MINVEFAMDESRRMASLKVIGHADYDVPGKDIICAGASMLATTLAQNLKMEYIKGILKYEPRMKLKEGNTKISGRAVTDDDYAEMLHTFLVIQAGYQVLAYNYPDFVSVEMFG